MNLIEDLMNLIEELTYPVEDLRGLVEVLLNPVEDSSNL